MAENTETQPRRNVRRFLVRFLGKGAGNFGWFLFFNFVVNWWLILAGAGLLVAGAASLFGCKVEIPNWMKHPLQTVWKSKDHIPAVEAVELADAKARKLAEEERARKLTEFQAEADATGMKYQADWPLEKLKVELKAHKERQEKAEREEKRRIAEQEEREREEKRKAPLYARADKIGLKPDPTMEYDALKRMVEAAEKELADDAEYQAALRKYLTDLGEWTERQKSSDLPNATCPNSRCKYPFQFYGDMLDIDNTYGRQRCPKCRLVFWASQARAMYVPEPAPQKPEPPKKNPGLLWRILH